MRSILVYAVTSASSGRVRPGKRAWRSRSASRGGIARSIPAHDAAILDRLEMVAKLVQVRAAAELLEAERQHLVAIVAR